MTSPIAEGVMAATYKLVQQAMTGQWQDVPKTIEERRVMLDQLSASATPQDQQWLSALKQAMAESDAAVAKMSLAGGSPQSGFENRKWEIGNRGDGPSLTLPSGAGEGIVDSRSAEGALNPPSGEELSNTAAPSTDGAIDSMIDMIRGSR